MQSSFTEECSSSPFSYSCFGGSRGDRQIEEKWY
jgi:hypothetical protein